MDKLLEFKDDNERLKELLKLWRFENSDIAFFKHKNEIADLTIKCLEIANSNKINNKILILNFQENLKLLFLNCYFVSIFERTYIDGLEYYILCLIQDKLNAKNKKFYDYLEIFHKQYNNWINWNSFHFFVFQIVIRFELAIKTGKDVNKEITKLILNISKFNYPEQDKGYLFLIIIILAFHKWDFEFITKIILNNKKNLFSYIRTFLLNTNYKYPLMRLFRLIFIDLAFKLNDKNEIAHYTSLESLESILRTKTLKFTKLENLNDNNENKLLKHRTPNKVFSISFTSKKDSIALFNQYTNLNGVALVFNKEALIQKLECLSFFEKNTSGDEVYHTLPFEFDHIQYIDNPKKIANKVLAEVFDFFKEFIPKDIIMSNFNKCIEHLNYFYKNTPWDYEQEFRIALNIPHKSLEKEFIGGNYNKSKDEIFLNFETRKDLIKEIIVSPKVKKDKSELKKLNNILKKYECENIEIIETKANYKL